MKLDVKKILLPNLPYVFIFWFFNRVAEGCRLAEGADMVTKAMGAVSGLGALISKNPMPSFHPRDLLFGAAGAVIIRAVVYFKAKTPRNTATELSMVRRVGEIPTILSLSSIPNSTRTFS